MLEAIIIMLVGQSCGYSDFYMHNSNMTNIFWLCDQTTEDWHLSHLHYLWLEHQTTGVIYVTDSWQCVNELCDGIAYTKDGFGYAYRYLPTIEHEYRHLMCKCDFHPLQTTIDYTMLASRTSQGAKN